MSEFKFESRAKTLIVRMIFGLVVALCIAAIILTVNSAINTIKCDAFGTVLSVGGCSQSGFCGVLTDKGKAIARLPVVGEAVCVDKN